MTVDVRARAARVLVRIIVDGKSLADALPEGLGPVTDNRQRALLQELSYGTLRWYFRLDAMLGQLLRKPLKQRDADLRCLLLTGLYQLDQLAMPQRVAVHETVQATRALDKSWASGLVNGVLRNYQRNAAELEAAISEKPEACHAHPGWLIERLQSDWPDDWPAILAANNVRPPFSLRVNRQRVTRDEYMEILADQPLEATPLVAANEGIRLDKPVPVEALPGFSAGVVSVQDGAAQLAAGLLALEPGQRVLDACAAPGGKTAHILESGVALIGLTAIDIDASRLERIAENLSRLGLHADLVAADASMPSTWWDGVHYDRILLDAPCTATGVIRRHPDIKLLRKPDDVTALVSRQQVLLQSLWPLLTPGGMLLYSTCSVLAAENSEQIERFLALQADAAEIPVNASWGHACKHGRQLLPGENEMDGFYFACLHKTK
jgi:16S rRNA (cytosine967-C5)-methyltransferase